MRFFVLGVITIKGFALDAQGDVVIQKHKIVMIEDKALKLQTIRTVLNTNKKEWFMNSDEGINFQNIFVKNPDYDVIKSEIAGGLVQVDENLMLKSFKYELDKERRLKLDFEATDGSEDIIYNSDTVNLDNIYTSDNDNEPEPDMTEEIKQTNAVVIGGLQSE